MGHLIGPVVLHLSGPVILSKCLSETCQLGHEPISPGRLAGRLIGSLAQLAGRGFDSLLLEQLQWVVLTLLTGAAHTAAHILCSILRSKISEAEERGWVICWVICGIIFEVVVVIEQLVEMLVVESWAKWVVKWVVKMRDLDPENTPKMCKIKNQRGYPLICNFAHFLGCFKGRKPVRIWPKFLKKVGNLVVWLTRSGQLSLINKIWESCP